MVVVVIIGILATITLIAYNGIQGRARNSQTLAAANQWTKILKIYQARNGAYPASATCLGEGYKYGMSGTDTSGAAMCHQNGSAIKVVTDTAVISDLSKYGTNTDAPAMITASNSDNDWYRGLTYEIVGTNATIAFVLDGGSANGCPNTFADSKIGSGQLKASNGNYICRYTLGDAVGY